MELREKKEYSIKLAISQFTPEYQSDDKVGALTPICEKQQKQFIHTIKMLPILENRREAWLQNTFFTYR